MRPMIPASNESDSATTQIERVGYSSRVHSRTKGEVTTVAARYRVKYLVEKDKDRNDK